jgi:hypothetical protein
MVYDSWRWYWSTSDRSLVSRKQGEEGHHCLGTAHKAALYLLEEGRHGAKGNPCVTVVNDRGLTVASTPGLPCPTNIKIERELEGLYRVRSDITKQRMLQFS